MNKWLITASVVLAAVIAAVAQEKKAFRLATEEDHQNYFRFLPETNDEWFNSLKNKNLLFYSNSEMPPAYQLNSSIHSVNYNISARKPAEPYGNANIEFPWGNPAGTDNCPNVKSFKFVFLPDAVRWWSDTSLGELTIQWHYPQGTVFGEVLLVTDPAGYDYTFEVRIRNKTKDGWKMDVYRPFLNLADLEAKIKLLNAQVSIKGFQDPDDGESLLWNQHPVTIFNRTALVRHLPPIDHSLVKRLLKETKFQSALGHEWAKSEKGLECHAPTTKADFHIVPKNYQGHYLAVDSKSCMTCHNTTLRHADEFQRRDWYGRVRGSDGIFSFHIFDHSCISNNGFQVQPRLRQDLISAGLLKHWRE